MSSPKSHELEATMQLLSKVPIKDFVKKLEDNIPDFEGAAKEILKNTSSPKSKSKATAKELKINGKNVTIIELTQKEDELIKKVALAPSQKAKESALKKALAIGGVVGSIVLAYYGYHNYPVIGVYIRKTATNIMQVFMNRNISTAYSNAPDFKESTDVLIKKEHALQLYDKSWDNSFEPLHIKNTSFTQHPALVSLENLSFVNRGYPVVLPESMRILNLPVTLSKFRSLSLAELISAKEEALSSKQSKREDINKAFNLLSNLSKFGKKLPQLIPKKPSPVIDEYGLQLIPKKPFDWNYDEYGRQLIPKKPSPVDLKKPVKH